jgi:hypothetical protein
MYQMALIEITSSLFVVFELGSLKYEIYLQAYPLSHLTLQKVISTKAKGMIGAFITLILLSTALVTASTKGWLFGLNKNNGEHVAARIQVRQGWENLMYFKMHPQH